MRRTATRTATIAAIATGLLAIPVAASAHPALNPNLLPPGEAVESVLVVPHGCAPGGGMPMGEEADGAVPTVELAIQKTDEVTLEPGDVEGWTTADDGEAWVWSDAGGATTDVIQFPVTLTVTGSAGDEIWLKAFQECEDGSSFQWLATPEEEAQWPAVFVSVSDGEVGTAPAPEGIGESMDDMEMDDMADGEMDDMAAGEMDASEMDMSEGDDMAMDAGEPAGDDGLSLPLVVLIAVVLLAAVAGIVMRARRG